VKEAKITILGKIMTQEGNLT